MFHTITPKRSSWIAPSGTILAALAIALFAGACAASPSEAVITEANDGQRVQLSSGQVLSVNLTANPSTGYSWEVSAINAEILQQMGDPEFKSDSTLVGAPGKQLIRFKVVAKGEGKLELVYHRPWEKDTPPERTFSVNVTAQ
jgi:inhibitor of cysteine peptidase